MKNLQEKALELHNKGYNCAQAVCMVWADKLNIDDDLLFKLSEGFGAGTGNLQGSCGAISAAIMIAGLTNSGGKDSQIRTKGNTYKLATQINNEFIARIGALYCKDIKGINTGKPLRSCNDCIIEAVNIIQEYIFNNT